MNLIVFYILGIYKSFISLLWNLPVPKSPRLEDAPYLDIIGEDHMMDPDMIACPCQDPQPKKDYAFRDRRILELADSFKEHDYKRQ